MVVDSSWAVNTVICVVRDLELFQDGMIIPLDLLESFILFLELVYRDINAEQTLDGLDVDNGESELIRGVIATMREQQEEAPNATQVQ